MWALTGGSSSGSESEMEGGVGGRVLPAASGEEEGTGEEETEEEEAGMGGKVRNFVSHTTFHGLDQVSDG